MSERTSEFFDRYAVGFDAIYGNDNRAFERIINRLFRRAMLVRYRKTLAGCQPVEGRTVIDIGCGPGHYSIALARAGAAQVLGLDFAPGMLTIARDSAQAHGVARRCTFALGDFLSYPISQPFDFAVVMGFMDYVSEPRRVVDRVIEITRGSAFFSFPKAGGPLAWQRQLRYRNRCDLFLYREDQIHGLFSSAGVTYSIEPIGRDFFVTLEAKNAEGKTP